jgi:hypothetical protein
MATILYKPEEDLFRKEAYMDIKQLANRIYDLDQMVYSSLGSALGHVFNRDRDKAVSEMVALMQDANGEHALRSRLALISNMARTIPDKELHKKAMTEYDLILKDLRDIPHGIGNLPLLDKDQANLNELYLKNRFPEGQHLIICISRSFGSAGNDIGFLLADKLQINYYDAEIFSSVMKRLEAAQDHVSDYSDMNEQSLDLLVKPNSPKEHESFSQRVKRTYRYHGLNTRDAFFFNQSDLLCDLAKKRDFVVMGRCADRIFTSNAIPHVSIFITAPLELRVQRVMRLNHIDHWQALRLVRKIDHTHASYYRYYTGRKWGNAGNYDLCLNSSAYGVEGTVDLILQILGK